MKKPSRNKPRKIDDARLRKLWPSRLTDDGLAKAMGHTPSVLRRRATKLGLPLRRTIWAEGASE